MKEFPVLMYHEIIKRGDFEADKNIELMVKQNYKDSLPKPLFCFFEEFEKQMNYLYENGYKTLKLKQVIDFYYNDKELPEKVVLLTFDDMYKSVLKYAYPILKKYNFSAVGFVVLDWLFDEEKEYSSSKSVCLSKKELNSMSDVFEYANHSKELHTRKGGCTSLQTVDRYAFKADYLNCEEFVNVKNIFAYPFGIYTKDIIDWLKEFGCKIAFTTEPGKNSVEDDTFKLKRNGVFLNYSLDDFKNILNN